MAKLPSIEPAESFGARPIPQPATGAVSYRPTTGAETVVGGAQTAFGQQVEKTTTEFQSIMNETRAKDADAKFTQAAIDMTYDPQNGYYTKLGKDAVDAYVPASNAMQAKFKEVRDSLPNSDTQRQFDSYALSTMRRELITMAGHAAQQSKQWQVESSNARIKTYQASAAANHNNDVAFGQALNTIDSEVLQQGKIMGWDDATIHEHQAKEVSTAWSDRLRRQMLQDPIGAQKLYRENMNDILPEQQPIIEGELKHSVMPVQAKNLATEIMAPDIPKGGDFVTAKAMRANLGKWMKDAEGRAADVYPNDPVFRDMVVGQIQNYTNKVAGAEEAVIRNSRDEIAQTLMTPKADGSKISDLDELLAQPGMHEKWNHLDGITQTSVLAVLGHNAKGQDPPETSEALAKWHTIRGLAYTDPLAFKEYMDDPVKFKELTDTLPHALSRELIGLDSSLDKGTATLEAKGTSIKHALETAKQSLLAAGIAIPTKPGDKAKVYDQFASRLADQVDHFFESNKRKPNDHELMQMTNSLLTQGAIPGNWLGTAWPNKVRAFQAEPGQFYVPVPTAERGKIVADYKALKGIEPTDSQIGQIYTASQLKKGAK